MSEAERPISNPASAIAKWLDHIDTLGHQIPLQKLTERKLSHPLQQNLPNSENHFLNLQLGVIVADVINNPLYFPPVQATQLLTSLQNEDYLKLTGSQTDPQVAVTKLAEKQTGYLAKGESWQFAKTGLEVSNEAQQIAFKLHALQELIEPFAGKGATEYEDQISDILTKAILGQESQYKLLARAIGPYPWSLRWVDFLEWAENRELFHWIKTLQRFAQKQDFEPSRLTIIAGKSEVTPDTTIQILERKTFRSTGKVPPLRPEDVADPHYHNNKIELYLPLMGAGFLKLKTTDGKIHEYSPDPNMATSFELTNIGAKAIEGVPVLIYQGKEYRPEGRFINVPLGVGKTAQFIVVMPGETHDYQNVGISPASAFALTVGFPKSEGASLENDFYASAF